MTRRAWVIAVIVVVVVLAVVLAALLLFNGEASTVGHDTAMVATQL